MTLKTAKPDSVEGDLLELDDRMQSELYERFTSGQITKERYQILTQKFELWQVLSRELFEALSTEGVERPEVSAELEHLALLADHVQRTWAQYGKQIREGCRQIAESGDLFSAMIATAPEVQDGIKQLERRDPQRPPGSQQ
jgi:hypothetical protein